jgi:hypothetical protein
MAKDYREMTDVQLDQFMRLVQKTLETQTHRIEILLLERENEALRHELAMLKKRPWWKFW